MGRASEAGLRHDSSENAFAAAMMKRKGGDPRACIDHQACVREPSCFATQEKAADVPDFEQRLTRLEKLLAKVNRKLDKLTAQTGGR